MHSTECPLQLQLYKHVALHILTSFLLCCYAMQLGSMESEYSLFCIHNPSDDYSS